MDDTDLSDDIVKGTPGLKTFTITIVLRHGSKSDAKGRMEETEACYVRFKTPMAQRSPEVPGDASKEEGRLGFVLIVRGKRAYRNCAGVEDA